MTTLLVPAGAEAAAVRRGAGAARIVAIPAGTAAATNLPAFAADETVVVLGLCGALGALRVGNVAVYRSVTDGHTTSTLAPALAERLASTIPHARLVDACSAGRVVTDPGERRALAARYGAEVVDMEGAALAAALHARGVRVGMVRVVSDDPSRAIPPIADAIGADGRVDARRVALAFGRAPLAALSFVAGVRRALAVLRAVAAVTVTASG